MALRNSNSLSTIILSPRVFVAPSHPQFDLSDAQTILVCVILFLRDFNNEKYIV